MFDLNNLGNPSSVRAGQLGLCLGWGMGKGVGVSRQTCQDAGKVRGLGMGK